jgi:hypothetical protein
VTPTTDRTQATKVERDERRALTECLLLAQSGVTAPTLFREFAAECTQLAQAAPTPEKRALYLRMASVWHQFTVRWEKKS